MVMHMLLPHFTPNLQAFALVGMAGFLAGVAKTPLSAIIMVSEMTLGYGLLVPLMLTQRLLMCSVRSGFPCYVSQVDARVDWAAHEGEFVNAALEHILVKEALPKDAKMTVFYRNTPLHEILNALSNTKQQVFPVLCDDQTLYGVIDFHDIRIFFSNTAYRIKPSWHKTCWRRRLPS